MKLAALNQSKLDKLKLRASMKNQTFKPWCPKERECLAGQFLCISSFRHGSFGEQFVMKIRDSEDIFWDVYLNDWLKNELDNLNAVFGDYVAVIFKGQVKQGHGFSYNSYILEIDKTS